MEILFIMTPAMDPERGGVQQTTYKLGKYFTEHDYTVSYYSLEKEGHIKMEYGRLYSAPNEGRNNNTDNISHMKLVIDEIKPDIVINQMPYEKEIGNALINLKGELDYVILGCLRNSLFNFKNNVRIASRQLLPQLLFKIVDNPVGMKLIQARHWVKHRYQLRRILNQHDYFILLAPPNRQELEYFVGNYKAEKVRSIPNSIPQVHNDLGKKKKIILYVGRLNISQKRSDLLIKFWQECHHKVPGWEFMIVGDGPYMKTIKRQISEENLPRVSLEGFQKPDSYYKKASIFVMTSAYEGFPNVLLEAQSFGCAPVLFNSYLALNAIVDHQTDAFLIPPFDVEEMAQNVGRLAKNPGLLDDIQNAALQNARQYTLEKVGKQWENFFKTSGVLI